MSDIFYIYLYHDPATGVPFYVGKGKNFRCFEHLWYAQELEWNAQDYYNPYLIRKIRKMICEEQEPLICKWHTDLSNVQALVLEKIFIKLIGRRDLGLGSLCNLTDGGEGISGYEYTEEQCKARRERSLAFYKTEKGLARRKAHSQYMQGRLHSQETKDAIHKAHIGKSHSQETKDIISTVLEEHFQTPKGLAQREAHSKWNEQYWTEEKREVHSEFMNEWWQTPEGRLQRERDSKQKLGHLCSQETKDAIRKAHIGKPRSQETKAAISKALMGRPSPAKGKKRVYHEDGSYSLIGGTNA